MKLRTPEITPQMTMKIALALWAAVVVVWPERTEVENTLAPTTTLTAGESLYKAELTQTNFGLLGVHFFESADNHRNWEIRAKFAELNRKDDYFNMHQVTAEFYGKDNGNVVHVTSDHGRSYLGRNYIELEGNVHIVSSQGYQFEMARLDYDGVQRTFATEPDTAVSMKGPDAENPTMYLQGEGMKGSADKEYFAIQKKVQARRRMSTSEWLNIRSQTAEFFTQKQKAIFYKRVRAQMPRVTILSDRFELETGEGDETIVAVGNVTLYNRDRTGRADKATVQMSDDEILLEGRAKIVTDGDTMQGDQILIYSQDDRVEVRAAKGTVRR